MVAVACDRTHLRSAPVRIIPILFVDIPPLRSAPAEIAVDPLAVHFTGSSICVPCAVSDHILLVAGGIIRSSQICSIKRIVFVIIVGFSLGGIQSRHCSPHTCTIRMLCRHRNVDSDSHDQNKYDRYSPLHDRSPVVSLLESFFRSQLIL